MALANGPTITSPTVGQVLAQAVFPTPRHVRAKILITTTYGFDALLQMLDGEGRILADDIVLKVGQSMWDSPAYGPFILPANSRLQVVMRHTPETMPSPLEVQASIFYTDWAER